MALIRKSKMGPGDGIATTGRTAEQEFASKFGLTKSTPTTLENFMEGKKSEEMANLAKGDPNISRRFGDQGKYLLGMGYRGRFMKDATGKEVYVLAPMQDAKGSYTKEGDKQVAFVYVDGSQTAKKALINPKDGTISNYEEGGRAGSGGYSAKDILSDAWSRYSGQSMKTGEALHKGGKVQTRVGGREVIIQSSGAEGASAGTGTSVKASEFEEKAGEKIGVKDRNRKTPTLKKGTKSYPSNKPKK